MRFYKIFICLFFLYVGCSNQSESNYIDYYHNINRIEVLIRKQNYSEAITAYDELREFYPNLFSTHLHNLAICYLKTNQVDKAISIVRQLVLQGQTLENFNKFEEFKAIVNKNEWKAFVEIYPVLRNKYEKKVDNEFISIINEAYVFDQEFQKTSDEKRDSVYYHQGKMLFDYIFENGFPDFFKNEEINAATRLSAMLRHFFYLPGIVMGSSDLASRKPYSEMSFNKPYNDCMLKAVFEGKLLPATFEMIMYSSDNSPYGFVGICFDFDTETVSLNFGPQNSSHEEINENRRAIGLPLVDSTAGNLEGTWYKQVSFKEMKEAYSNCSSCSTHIDYWRLSTEIKERVRSAFIDEELESFKFSFDPGNLRASHMKGSKKYMPNLKK